MIDTSKIAAHELANMIVGWICGDDNSAAIGAELAKDIRGERNAGKEPTCTELAGYVLRAIGSQESVASYLAYHLGVEQEEED